MTKKSNATKSRNVSIFVYTDSMGLAYILTPKFAADGFYFDDDRLEILRYAKQLVENRDPEKADAADVEIIKCVAKMSSLTGDKKKLLQK